MAIDLSKFLKMPEYDIVIVTYRDIFQSHALEEDRFGDSYRGLSAVVILDKKDMNKMGIKEGSKVRISNSNGSVVVAAKEAKTDEAAGVAYMVNGPWSNMLVDAGAEGSGIPDYKYIRAKISAAKEEVTSVASIVDRFKKA